MKSTQVARLLAYVTGMVNQQLLLRNEYLLAENRILRSHLPSRLLLTDPERSTLAVLGKRLGHRVLELVVWVIKNQSHLKPMTCRQGPACNGTLPRRTLIVRNLQLTSTNGADLVDFVPVQILRTHRQRYA